MGLLVSFGRRALRVAGGAGLGGQRGPGPSPNAPEGPVLIPRLCSRQTLEFLRGRRRASREMEKERGQRRKGMRKIRGELGMVTQWAGCLSVLAHGKMSEAFRLTAAALREGYRGLRSESRPPVHWEGAGWCRSSLPARVCREDPVFSKARGTEKST